jgi:hypothetical protein
MTSPTALTFIKDGNAIEEYNVTTDGSWKQYFPISKSGIPEVDMIALCLTAKKNGATVQKHF